MEKDMLKFRTKIFALKAIEFTGKTPKNRLGIIVENQLLRCATSVGCNYRSIKAAKSTKDFINKMNIVYEEADEAQYWLELLMDSKTMKEEDILPLYQEAKEITAMTVASIKTAKINNRKKF